MKPTTLTFTETGDFKALSAAYKWCLDHDFSYGPLCGKDPVALVRGRARVAKWKNLTVIERLKIDGKMTSPDFLNGPVTLEIF